MSQPPTAQPPSGHPPSSNAAVRGIRQHPALFAFGIVGLAVVVLLLLWDWNWFKGPVERQVEAKTGRTFKINGDLDVDLGRVTTIRADDLQFGNAPWSKQPQMATADRLEILVEPLALLFQRELRIPALRVDKPQLYLETGPDDSNNWTFETGDDPGPKLPNVWIKDGQLQYLDAPRKTSIDLRVNSIASRGGAQAPPIRVDGGGRWSGNAFTLDGTAQSPLDLQQTAKPYAIDLRAGAGATRAHASGNLVNPFALRDMDLEFALSGKNLEDLYPLTGVALPLTPPYALDGRLRRDGATWHYDGFTGKVGDSDLGGSAAVTFGGKRPFLKADLVSKRLDFDDLAGFIGAAPQSGASEATSPELEALAAKQAANPRVLPDDPFSLEKLRAMDADVRLRAQRINAPSLPLDDMDAHLKLADGLLTLEPLNFGVAGGDIRSNIRMDAREKTIRTRADITARGIALNKLFKDATLTQDAVGALGGHLKVTGQGNSIARMLGSANGDIAIGMGKGQISNLLMEFAGIDIAESLKYLIGKDKKVPIRCAFGDFSVKDGLMTSRALAFDTTDTIIVGSGTVSLRDETLDLRLRPRPKDRTFLALRSPLLVGGTFKDPSFRPDLARLGLRGAIALALASIAPPAALLATIDLGGGKDADCGGHYAE